jgi:CRISPR type III-A-associated RAMP protein Csm4
MNPGLVVKLRPTGPWRIGTDSGERNRVDSIYHSDSLYAAVTSAVARLGSLEEWLDATARAATPAVCFSSCFPFVEEIGFVVPPRTIWPPASPALLSAHVRWKRARFVPLGIVQAVLAGQTLDEKDWAIDAPSECLVPAGRQGPFRTGLRWNAAVDRMTGAAERHSTACLEFRPGAGLWTIVSFAGEAARARWMDVVKAAFRWLADSGFGGERSRGWGRAESPEFVEGTLPDMILGSRDQGSGVGDQGLEAAVKASGPDILPLAAGGQGPGAGEAAAVIASGPDVLPGPPAGEPEEPSPVPPVEEPPAEPPAPDPDPEPPAPPPEPLPEPLGAEAAPAPESPEPGIESSEAQAPPEPPAPGPRPLAPVPAVAAHWLLSLFAPAAADAVDWARGNYALVTRGGRIDSPTAAGDLKKQLQMVAEGSVVYAAGLQGSAPDVAPDGFAHPVFRAGFALAIPLPALEGTPL